MGSQARLGLGQIAHLLGNGANNRDNVRRQRRQIGEAYDEAAAGQPGVNVLGHLGGEDALAATRFAEHDQRFGRRVGNVTEKWIRF